MVQPPLLPVTSPLPLYPTALSLPSDSNSVMKRPDVHVRRWQLMKSNFEPRGSPPVRIRAPSANIPLTESQLRFALSNPSVRAPRRVPASAPSGSVRSFPPWPLPPVRSITLAVQSRFGTVPVTPVLDGISSSAASEGGATDDSDPYRWPTLIAASRSHRTPHHVRFPLFPPYVSPCLFIPVYLSSSPLHLTAPSFGPC